MTPLPRDPTAEPFDHGVVEPVEPVETVEAVEAGAAATPPILPEVPVDAGAAGNGAATEAGELTAEPETPVASETDVVDELVDGSAPAEESAPAEAEQTAEAAETFDLSDPAEAQPEVVAVAPVEVVVTQPEPASNGHPGAAVAASDFRVIPPPEVVPVALVPAAPEVGVVPETVVAPRVVPTAEPVVIPYESPADAAPVPTKRLMSLDALRGFDMLWIIGLDSIAEGLRRLAEAGYLRGLEKPLAFVQNQLTHRAWEGLAFEDLIFPLFVFIVGVSIVFSLTKALSQKSTRQVVWRIILRTALLYLLGLIVYKGFDQPIHAFAGQTHHHHAVRWLGVLQRIAICYGAAALLFCFVRLRYLVLTAVLLLVGYWLLMSFVSVPGVGRGSYAEGHNLANYLDQRYLGGFKWDRDHDPEGYLSTFPAIATCLLGVFAGMVLRGERPRPAAKFAALLLGGAALAALGYAWGFRPSPVHMPVIKKLWTSSYVLLAGGYSAMMLAVFYLVIDIWRLRAWATPFVWVGANAITLYFLAELGGFHIVAARLVGGGSHDWPLWGAGQTLITALVALALVLALARFLYKRAVFIRV